MCAPRDQRKSSDNQCEWLKPKEEVAAEHIMKDDDPGL
jgi:hypothetical protein